MAYASRTKVSVQQSRNEIEKLLMKYGAGSFYYGGEPTYSIVGFKIRGRLIKITLPLPEITPRLRVTEVSNMQQEHRRRWRALLLIIKAKLEAIDTGISTLEREFLSDVVLPNGATVGEWLGPQIQSLHHSGQMPTALIEGGK